jgi:hypothetical protein
MLYNITESKIDRQGTQYICGMLEEPKFNKDGLWHGIKAFDITIDHRKQKCVVATFDWINGVACNFKNIKRINNEVVGVSEVERVLKECGIIV